MGRIRKIPVSVIWQLGKVFPYLNRGSEDEGCCAAVQIVKPSDANLWFMTLGFINKMDLTWRWLTWGVHVCLVFRHVLLSVGYIRVFSVVVATWMFTLTLFTSRRLLITVIPPTWHECSINPLKNDNLCFIISSLDAVTFLRSLWSYQKIF